MRSLSARIASHASAWANLPGLRRLNLDKCFLQEMAAGVYNYAGGFFAPDQIPEEIVAALKEVRALQPRSVVEIGANGGGTLLMWSRVARPEATLVSIDLRDAQPGSRISRLRAPLFRRMGLPGQKIRLIEADSHDPHTLDRARRCLGGKPVDFLFIDGDHSDAGVRAGYRMYVRWSAWGGLSASAMWRSSRRSTRSFRRGANCAAAGRPSPSSALPPSTGSASSMFRRGCSDAKNETGSLREFR